MYKGGLGSKSSPCGSKSPPCGSKSPPCGSKSSPCGSKSSPCGSKSSPCGSKSSPCGSKSSRRQTKTSASTFKIRRFGVFFLCRFTSFYSYFRPSFGFLPILFKSIFHFDSFLPLFFLCVYFTFTKSDELNNCT